jgi:hypothetical protein
MITVCGLCFSFFQFFPPLLLLLLGYVELSSCPEVDSSIVASSSAKVKDMRRPPDELQDTLVG